MDRGFGVRGAATPVVPSRGRGSAGGGRDFGSGEHGMGLAILKVRAGSQQLKGNAPVRARGHRPWQRI